MIGARILIAVILGFILTSPYARAIGLGDARLESWLGQRLNVTITLTDTDNLSLDEILVRQIYGQNAQRLNLEDAISNTRYIVATETDAQSNILVKVSSRAPIGEPFVSFVLQVEMPGGSLSREYTLLIDMPTTSIDALSNDSNVTGDRLHAPNDLVNIYTVQQGDTLGQVAQRIRPDESIRLKAIINKLYDRNRSSFEADDINRLINGAELRLPSATEYAAMPKRQLLTPAKQKIRASAAPSQPATLEQHLYTIYTVNSGDTLSQIADVMRPSKRINLNAATQTLINHNIEAVGTFGGHLSIGQLLRIPPDETFYLEAGLPLIDSASSHSSAQTSKIKPDTSKNKATALANNRVLTSKSAITEQSYSHNSKNTALPNPKKLHIESQKHKNALASINEQAQERSHQDTELLLKLDHLMALQQKQLAMTQRLIKAQQTTAKNVFARYPTSPAGQANIENSQNYLYWLIAILSFLVIGLSARLYWLLNLKRSIVTPVELKEDRSSNSNKQGNPEHTSEFEHHLQDSPIAENQALSTYTERHKNRMTKGESAESKQNDRDRELHQKLAQRNLEASNTPAFDNNFIDSVPINLDDIFQPGDDDSITSLNSSHSHVENDLESDVIWQANIYSAYGQYLRAENLLNKGLSSHPESIALKLALLDIYARSEQFEKFELMCTKIPQKDPSIKASIKHWREEFHIPQEKNSF